MDLQSWLSSLGFHFTPILNGKRHRCDRNGTKKDTNVWYIGSEEKTLSGNVRQTLTIGDWSTGEKHFYPGKSGSTWSDEERAYYTKKWAEEAKQYEKEEQEKWEKVSREAEEIWTAGIDGLIEQHSYCLRKQITPNEIKVLEECLIIPMRDISGRLWGIQKIYPDGTKRFLSGQRTKGMSFAFEGGTNDIIAICEGFATGASLSLCGFATYVAFNAGNLKEVATEVTRLYRNAQIIICGDDDRWKPESGNPGREKAEEAARACGGIAVFPSFNISVLTETTQRILKPTDFNDLHVLEGIDEVRRQIEAAKE